MNWHYAVFPKARSAANQYRVAPDVHCVDRQFQTVSVAHPTRAFAERYLSHLIEIGLSSRRVVRKSGASRRDVHRWRLFRADQTKETCPNSLIFRPRDVPHRCWWLFVVRQPICAPRGVGEKEGSKRARASLPFDDLKTPEHLVTFTRSPMTTSAINPTRQLRDTRKRSVELEVHDDDCYATDRTSRVDQLARPR